MCEGEDDVCGQEECHAYEDRAEKLREKRIKRRAAIWDLKRPKVFATALNPGGYIDDIPKNPTFETRERPDVLIRMPDDVELPIIFST